MGPERHRHRYGVKALNQERITLLSIIIVFIVFLGAPTGTRTPGPLIKSQLLYQLSYWRTIRGHLRNTLKAEQRVNRKIKGKDRTFENMEKHLHKGQAIDH